mgnify:CR=1 FL=1
MYVLLVLSNSPLFVQLLFSMCLGVVKVLWGMLFIPRVYRNTIYIRNDEKGMLSSSCDITLLYPLILRHELIADIWCYILCPLIVILTTSSTCYRYVLSGMSSIDFEYQSRIADWRSESLVVCGANWTSTFSFLIKHGSDVTVSTSVTPPWLYSYQCSSAIVTSYVSVVYYTYIIYALIVPCVKVASYKWNQLAHIRIALVHDILHDLHEVTLR